jgi:hypothetical protein
METSLPIVNTTLDSIASADIVRKPLFSDRDHHGWEHEVTNQFR